LNELSSQLVALQALSAESSSRQVQASGDSRDRIQEVLNNSLIGGLKADLARIEVRLQELNARLGESHPQVIEAKANIAELKVKVEAETKRVTSGVGISNTINRSRLADVSASLAAQRTKMLQMKAVRDEGSVLLRDVENAQRTYDQILQRLNQTTLESQATLSNVAVLTQAVPPVAPTSPRLSLNMAIGVFLGALLAVGISLVLELFDRRVRSAEDVVLAVALPIIGVMPAPTAKRLFGRTAKANLMQRRLLGSISEAGKSA
jgi:succinoglycan biosynthesis transport protein ExoP